ncbi:MAG TPA: peptidyl-prolyl cis-trans isomerase [Terriglobales bacterium]|jgi:peptidyl-prolyl cis-trans isomerase D
MLNFFRRRDTFARLVLGGFMVIICVAMAMFLIPQGAGSDSSAPISQQTVATVSGTAITGQQLTDQLSRMEQGQQIPASLAPLLGQQVLKNLVAEQAITDQAQALGLAPTTQEIVAAARTAAPQLYPNGQYVGDDQAAQILASGQMTLADFQQTLRQNLMVNKIYDLITDPVRVSDAEVQQQFKTDNEKATFDYVLLDPTALQSQVTVTPAALAAYYKQHQANYDSPEQRQLEVLLANVSTIGAQIQISPQAVDQYYQQNLAQYTHPERVKVSHILIKYPNTTPTAAEIAATQQQAETVLKQVKPDGSNFAALAKQYSQDSASATLGGELGFIQKNQTVPNFEKAAFSLPAGQISGLVQTEYGFHIIKVEAHEAASVQPEAEVHDQIVSQLQQDQAVDKAQNLMNQAANLAQSTPLPQVAKQLNLQYFSTAPLGRADPVAGIGVNPDFASAVFSASVGALTPPVQVAQGFALAKVDKIIPPGPQPLAAVQDTVTSDYKAEQAKTLAQTQAQDLQKAAAKQGLKAAAAGLHLTVKTSPALTRSGSLGGDGSTGGSISSFASTLFALKPGQVGPVTSFNNGQLVYALDTLQEPSPADFAAQRAAAQSKLLDQKRNNVFNAYTDSLVAGLTKQGKIKIDQAAFQRVLGGDTNAPSSPSAPATPPPQPLGIG